MGTADVLAGVQGAVVVPEDIEAFASAVAGVMRDPARRQSLAAHAREDAARWSSRHMAQRLLDLYRRVVEEEDIEEDIRVEPRNAITSSAGLSARGDMAP
jgi:glycosyltransferase involved in cell wall biosynthesis